MKFCGIFPVHMICPDTTGDTSALRSHMPNLCVCVLLGCILAEFSEIDHFSLLNHLGSKLRQV